MKNILKVIFVIIGTIIGAGFASGKEVYIFFNKYGICGIIGILISGLILGVLIYKVLYIFLQQKEIDEYNELLNYIFVNRKSNRFDIVKIVTFIINIFLLISFYIMVAGFSSYFKQEYGISIYITSGIFAILCYITLNNNIEGIIKISTALVPIIIIFILNLGSEDLNYSINQITNMNFFGDMLIDSVISSVLYASYNSIILIPVLISLKKYISKKNTVLIGTFTALIVILLSIFVYMILLKANVEIIKLDLPLIYVVKQFGKIYEYLYGAVIIISIFTSALSAGYSFLKNCSKTQKQYNKLLIIMCVTSVFIASIGFSELVNILYPIFGVLGIIQIYCILKIKI